MRLSIGNRLDKERDLCLDGLHLLSCLVLITGRQQLYLCIVVCYNFPMRQYSSIKERLSGETSFFFTRPSFFTGFARLIDFGCALKIPDELLTDPDHDWEALRSDWNAVGQDMTHAICVYERSTTRGAAASSPQ